MAKVGKFCLAKRVKVEWLFQKPNDAKFRFRKKNCIITRVMMW